MTSPGYRATYWLRGYDKQGDKLMDEVPLRPIELAELRSIFGTDKDDPMVDCYPVTSQHAAALRQYLLKPLQFATLDYFLECTAAAD